MGQGGRDTAAPPLLEAARFLAERGGYGIVWLDGDLVVRARYGRLVDFVEVDQPVTDTVLALVGLEQHVLSLGTRPGDVVELPAVSIHLPGVEIPRLNLTVFAHGIKGAFLLLASRANPDASLEAELSLQIRARLIAESQLKAKSLELEALNAELALANRDLEDFAGIISHDLQAPLRAMRYLSEDAGAALREERIDDARAGLEELARQSLRMSRMLSELLEYASVGRKEDVVAAVDTRRLVEDVVASMPCPPGFEIGVYGTWPTIAIAAAGLHLALRNLIANAIKHHDRDQGIVSVTAADGETHLEITVADDGAGIDPKLHEVIFFPFRTIGPQAGSGMGLAFVKRAVEAMQGTLEVRSDPAHQRGARFVLTLAKKEPAPRRPEPLAPR